MYTIIQLASVFFMLSPFFLGRANDLHERIAETAESILISRYADSGAHMEVRVVRTGGQIENTNHLEVIWPQKPDIPRALLRVEVKSTDVLKNSYEGWALLYVAHFDSVMVLDRSIKNDEAVEASDLSTVWTEITRFHGSPMTPDVYRRMASKGDIFANRYVAENRILKATDLRNSYDVHTGQQVFMSYERRGIVLELSCKSRNKGFEGDIVKLFSPDTQQMYRARVTGLQRASWIETLE